MPGKTLEIDIRSEPLGSGGSRLCFLYPGEPNKCIKICRPSSMLQKKSLRRCLRAWLSTKVPALNINWHEYHFWKKHTRDRPVPGLGNFFPNHYGIIKTTVGPGLVVECLRDTDGKISQSLETWLPNACKKDQKNIIEQLHEITGLFIKYSLPCFDWGPNNFLVQQTNSGLKLKLIDCEANLGNREFIPIKNWIPSLRRAKLENRIQRQLMDWLNKY